VPKSKAGVPEKFKDSIIESKPKNSTQFNEVFAVAPPKSEIYKPDDTPFQQRQI
jgi:hypothetical protein